MESVLIDLCREFDPFYFAFTIFPVVMRSSCKIAFSTIMRMKLILGTLIWPPSTPLVQTLISFELRYACMGHIAVVNKLPAASPSNHNSIMNNPGTCLDRYIPIKTLALSKTLCHALHLPLFLPRSEMLNYWKTLIYYFVAYLFTSYNKKMDIFSSVHDFFMRKSDKTKHNMRLEDF